LHVKLRYSRRAEALAYYLKGKKQVKPLADPHNVRPTKRRRASSAKALAAAGSGFGAQRQGRGLDL